MLSDVNNVLKNLLKGAVSLFLAVIIFSTPVFGESTAQELSSQTKIDCNVALQLRVIKDTVIDPTEQTKERQVVVGPQAVPDGFSDAVKQSLINEFAADGRPILIITDAWSGQKNGVVTVMEVIQREILRLTNGKVKVHYITPDQFKIKYHIKAKAAQDALLAYMSTSAFEKTLNELNPQAIHISVEGIIGKQAKRYLEKKGIPYTTAYHSMFPEFLASLVERYSPTLAGILKKIVYNDLRKFHSTSSGILVPTPSMAKKLTEEDFNPDQIRYWSHGVETNTFTPDKASDVFKNLKRPISLFIGRVASEKNIDDFLSMKVDGTKVVVGSGPDLAMLQAKYPDAVFVGRKNYAELPEYYASADVFVFPSLTDTFGLVQLEALSAGTPVVAYKVQGPVDVIRSDKVGVLAEYDFGKDPSGATSINKSPAKQANIARLEEAWKKALTLKREDCRAYALANSWERSTLEFMHFLIRLPRLP